MIQELTGWLPMWARNGAPTASQHGRMSAKTQEAPLVDLNCPICRLYLDGPDTIVEHLVTEHGISRREAGFFAKKVLEWRLNSDEVAARIAGILAQKDGHQTQQ